MTIIMGLSRAAALASSTAARCSKDKTAIICGKINNLVNGFALHFFEGESWMKIFSIIVSSLLALLVTNAAIAQDSLKAMISYSGSPNNQDAGPLYANGVVYLPQGGSGIIYGARTNSCSVAPPSFEEAWQGIKALPKGVGVIYDGGVGTRASLSCGGSVGARAIGIKLDPNFIGKVTIPFFGDFVTVSAVPIPAGQEGSLKERVSYESSPNNQDVGQLTSDGSVSIKQGDATFVYGVRDRGCVAKPPSFSTALALSGVVYVPQGIVKVYDAGVGYLATSSCPTKVGARAIGIKFASDFVGKVDVPYFDSKVSINVLPLASAVSVAGELSLPPDLKMETPAPTVPANCTRFFRQAGWGKGLWGGIIPNQLMVEKIADDCTATVVYVWGDAPTIKVEGGFARVQARIINNSMSFTLNADNPKVTVVYDISDSGNELVGKWRSEGPTQMMSSNVKLTPRASPR